MVELTAIAIGSGLGILASIPVSVALVLYLDARLRGSAVSAPPPPPPPPPPPARRIAGRPVLRIVKRGEV